jgi:hypothetical protein
MIAFFILAVAYKSLSSNSLVFSSSETFNFSTSIKPFILLPVSLILLYSSIIQTGKLLFFIYSESSSGFYIPTLYFKVNKLKYSFSLKNVVISVVSCFNYID